KMADNLSQFCDDNYPNSKMDLATVFVERSSKFAISGGSYVLVTPQNWLFLKSYKHIREKLLKEQSWEHTSWLGPGAFETIGGEVVKPILLIITNQKPTSKSVMATLDVSDVPTILKKSEGLRQ